jgi:hypothetical protein
MTIAQYQIYIISRYNINILLMCSTNKVKKYHHNSDYEKIKYNKVL